MININFRMLTDNCSYDKNVLYKIDTSRTVVFVEKHGKSCEKVYLEYALRGGQIRESIQKKTDNISELISFETSNVLRPYKVEAQKIRDFARRSVHICGKDYKLYVFILERASEAEYVKNIKVGDC